MSIYWIVAGVLFLLTVLPKMASTAKPPTPGGATVYNSSPTGPAQQTSGITSPSPTQSVRDTGLNVYGTGAKPQLVVAEYNPQTGVIGWICQYTSRVRGIGSQKQILFDVLVGDDGHNSAIYPAGWDCDFLDASGPGGTVRIQNYLATSGVRGTIDTVGAAMSEELRDPVTVLPDPATALRLYPASTPEYVMPTPSQSGAWNPDNTWFLI